MTTGHRFTAAEAVASGLVDASSPIDALARAATSRVEHLAGKDRKTLSTIKATLFADTVAALRAPSSKS